MKKWAEKKLKIYTRPEILEKMRSWCAYQERSTRQAILQLKQLGADGDWHEEIIKTLEDEGFINNERFAVQFALGKSKGRGWGAMKIKQRLQAEMGAVPALAAGMAQMDETAALEKLRKALAIKKEALEKKQDPQIKAKLIRFCLGRGFTLEQALEAVKKETSK